MVYKDLMRIVPGLEERLVKEGELEVIADYVRRFGNFVYDSLPTHENSFEEA